MSVEFTLCEEIAASIDGGTYSNSITPTADAEYVLDYKAESVSGIKTGVTPVGLNNGTNQKSALYNRSSFGDVWIISLVVVSNCKHTDNDKIKELTKYVSELQTRIANQSDTYSMEWNGQMRNNPNFDAQALKTDGIFMSITEFEFENERSFA